MKRVAALIVATISVVNAIPFLPVVSTQAYHDGRCGAQRWDHLIPVPVPDSDDPDYDEYGIVRRWEMAHSKPCEKIWIRGLLDDTDRSGYWAPLHLAIAKGERLEKIYKIMEGDGQAATRIDKLGRTTLHWAAIYPHERERTALVDRLVALGADPSHRDADGLTAENWRRLFDARSQMEVAPSQ
jgi:hypothetical protein